MDEQRVYHAISEVGHVTFKGMWSVRRLSETVDRLAWNQRDFAYGVCPDDGKCRERFLAYLSEGCNFDMPRRATAQPGEGDRAPARAEGDG